MLLLTVKPPSNSTATKEPKSSRLFLKITDASWQHGTHEGRFSIPMTGFCGASSNAKRHWQKALKLRETEETRWPVRMTDALPVGMFDATLIMVERKLGWSYFPVLGVSGQTPESPLQSQKLQFLKWPPGGFKNESISILKWPTLQE